MNEHSFVRSIHRRLPSTVHVWKINTRFAAGVPDAWYSGPGGDLWIEYKWIRKLPKTRKEINLPLTKLQQDWLTRRFHEGRRVAVVAGSEAGAAVTDGPPWVVSIDDFRSVKEIVEWIQRQTLCT